MGIIDRAPSKSGPVVVKLNASHEEFYSQCLYYLKKGRDLKIDPEVLERHDIAFELAYRMLKVGYKKQALGIVRRAVGVRCQNTQDYAQAKFMEIRRRVYEGQ